jgi:glyoxylase-like metal-dependent hydrolase (beta-lactamase superfamily II)
MRNIDVKTLQRWLEEGRPVTVLDVRQQADFAESHIPGSINTDVYSALKASDPSAMRDVQVPPNVPVVTVCGMGRASVIAARQLEERGVDVMSLEGGMRAWASAWNQADVPVRESTAAVVQVRRTAKGCLSYVIASNDSAAVIDPSLPAEVYAELCRQRGWSLRAVLDTHVHADHLSRARPLAELSGSALYLPANNRAQFAFKSLADGERLTVGNATFTALSTPGHTPESMTYVLDGVAAFTGDTLFLSSVGRPDLHNTPEQARDAARRLYHSVQRILALGPDTLVLPSHAAPPIAFDRVPIVATVAKIQAAQSLLQRSESEFVSALAAATIPTPPNYQAITRLNETGEIPPDTGELEAGANRCAAR